MGSLTFQNLQTNIANDLTRSDLSSQIVSAAQDAIRFYEPERFWFNQTRSLTFQTVPGQNTYTATDLSQIPNVIEFDHVFMRDSTSQWELDRQEYPDFEWLLGINTANGRPTDYCYVDGTLIFWPTPVAAFTVRPHMHYRFPMLAAPTDNTPWCNEAENLIRAHAKLILCSNLIEDDAGAARMQQQLPALKMRLDEETAARLSTGRIRATDF
jgi:hypothetical protein